MARRIIEIQVKTKGDPQLKQLTRSLDRVDKQTRKTARSLQFFRNAFNLAIAGIGVREITRVNDSFNLLRDRIKVFTGSGEEANKVFNQLADAARFTRTSVRSLAESYNRIALATQELGLSQDQILATTVALQQTFRLSGATIAEATSSTIQLSQGLSSAQLRGQELRSVLEQNAVFANILSKELGITRGQLIKFGETGKITSEAVLRALSKSAKQLNKDAENLGTTIGQSLTIAFDQLVLKINQVDKALGISEGITKSVDALIENFNDLALAIGTFAASRSILVLATQLKTLSTVITGSAILKAATSFNAIALGIAATVFGLKKFYDLVDERTSKEGLTKQLNAALQRQKELRKQLELTNETIRKAAPDRKKALEAFTGPQIEKINAQLRVLGVTITSLQGRIKKLGGPDAKRGISDLASTLDELKNSSKLTDKNLARLNNLLKDNKITLEQYDEALASIRLKELNKNFEEGKITVDQYRKSMLDLSQDIKGVNSVALGAEDGLRKVARESGNIAKQVSAAFVQTFNRLEDVIVDFVKKGQFEFSKFTQAVLDDLTRIIIRSSIISPLAQGLAGAIGTTTPPQTPVANANGNAFSNGRIIPFANGGVFNSPTFFPMSGGNTGMLGESGPEAIMPLTRRNGKLGVAGGGTVVNVINNSGGEVEQQERTGPDGNRILDIIISQKVRENIGSGRLDKEFSERYGLRARGR